jgi:hypothetical protein
MDRCLRRIEYGWNFIHRSIPYSTNPIPLCLTHPHAPNNEIFQKETKAKNSIDPLMLPRRLPSNLFILYAHCTHTTQPLPDKSISKARPEQIIECERIGTVQYCTVRQVSRAVVRAMNVINPFFFLPQLDQFHIITSINDLHPDFIGKASISYIERQP